MHAHHVLRCEPDLCSVVQIKRLDVSQGVGDVANAHALSSSGTFSKAGTAGSAATSSSTAASSALLLAFCKSTRQEHSVATAVVSGGIQMQANESVKRTHAGAEQKEG